MKTWQEVGMTNKRYLEADYCPKGCRVRRATRGVFGDPHARIVALERLQKKHTAGAVRNWPPAFTIARQNGFATCPAGQRGFTWEWKFDASIANGVAQ